MYELRESDIAPRKPTRVVERSYAANLAGFGGTVSAFDAGTRPVSVSSLREENHTFFEISFANTEQ